MLADRAVFAVLMGLLVGAAGCGYRAENLFREDIRTIYVAEFDNETTRRGLEVDLKRALVEELKLRTPFIFASRERADSILSGELTAAGEKALVKAEDGTAVLTGSDVDVRFRWTDTLTGTPIVPEQTVREDLQQATVMGDTPAALGSDPVPADLIPEDVDFRATMREAAQRIVERMQRNW